MPMGMHGGMHGGMQGGMHGVIPGGMNGVMPPPAVERAAEKGSILEKRRKQKEAANGGLSASAG